MIPIVSGLFKTEEVTGGGGCSGTSDYNSGSYNSQKDMTTSTIASGDRLYTTVLLASDFSSTIGDKRTITGINLKFNNSNGGTQFDSGFRIFLKNTTSTDATAAGAGDSTGLTQQYSSSGISNNTDINFTFSNSYTWDGTSNLMLIIETDGGSVTMNALSGWFITSTTTGHSWGFYNGPTYPHGAAVNTLTGTDLWGYTLHASC